MLTFCMKIKLILLILSGRFHKLNLFWNNITLITLNTQRLRLSSRNRKLNVLRLLGLKMAKNSFKDFID